MNPERDISLVHPVLPPLLQRIAALCDARGVDIVWTCLARTPQRQAELFRHGRSLAAIEGRARRLEKAGYPSLARLLLDTPPQPGRSGSRTCAAPGESWHQYGLAADAVPIAIVNKRMVCLWSGAAEWAVYGAAAREVGLEWAGAWKRFRETPHIQMTPRGAPSNPLRFFDRHQVATAMRAFGVEGC